MQTKLERVSDLWNTFLQECFNKYVQDDQNADPWYTQIPSEHYKSVADEISEMGLKTDEWVIFLNTLKINCVDIVLRFVKELPQPLLLELVFNGAPWLAARLAPMHIKNAPNENKISLIKQLIDEFEKNPNDSFIRFNLVHLAILDLELFSPDQIEQLKPHSNPSMLKENPEISEEQLNSSFAIFTSFFSKQQAEWDDDPQKQAFHYSLSDATDQMFNKIMARNLNSTEWSCFLNNLFKQADFSNAFVKKTFGVLLNRMPQKIINQCYTHLPAMQQLLWLLGDFSGHQIKELSTQDTHGILLEELMRSINEAKDDNTRDALETGLMNLIHSGDKAAWANSINLLIKVPEYFVQSVKVRFNETFIKKISTANLSYLLRPLTQTLLNEINQFSKKTLTCQEIKTIVQTWQKLAKEFNFASVVEFHDPLLITFPLNVERLCTMITAHIKENPKDSQSDIKVLLQEINKLFHQEELALREKAKKEGVALYSFFSKFKFIVAESKFKNTFPHLMAAENKSENTFLHYQLECLWKRLVFYTGLIIRLSHDHETKKETIAQVTHSFLSHLSSSHTLKIDKDFFTSFLDALKNKALTFEEAPDFLYDGLLLSQKRPFDPKHLTQKKDMNELKNQIKEKIKDHHDHDVASNSSVQCKI